MVHKITFINNYSRLGGPLLNSSGPPNCFLILVTYSFLVHHFKSSGPLLLQCNIRYLGSKIDHFGPVHTSWDSTVKMTRKNGTEIFSQKVVAVDQNEKNSLYIGTYLGHYSVDQWTT